MLFDHSLGIVFHTMIWISTRLFRLQLPLLLLRGNGLEPQPHVHHGPPFAFAIHVTLALLTHFIPQCVLFLLRRKDSGIRRAKRDEPTAQAVLEWDEPRNVDFMGKMSNYGQLSKDVGEHTNRVDSEAVRSQNFSVLLRAREIERVHRDWVDASSSEGGMRGTENTHWRRESVTPKAKNNGSLSPRLR